MVMSVHRHRWRLAGAAVALLLVAAGAAYAWPRRPDPLAVGYASIQSGMPLAEAVEALRPSLAGTKGYIEVRWEARGRGKGCARLVDDYACTRPPEADSPAPGWAPPEPGGLQSGDILVAVEGRLAWVDLGPGGVVTGKGSRDMERRRWVPAIVPVFGPGG